MKIKHTHSAILILFFIIGGLHASSEQVKVMNASQMTHEEWQSVRDLFLVSFTEAYKDLPLTQIDKNIKVTDNNPLTDWLQRAFTFYQLKAVQDSYKLIMIHEEEQLVGYILCHLVKDTQLVCIDHLAVSPTSQGKGFGKLLLQKTIEEYCECTAVVLTTRILNKSARSFYAKQGFYELDEAIDNIAYDSRCSILLKKDLR